MASRKPLEPSSCESSMRLFVQFSQTELIVADLRASAVRCEPTKKGEGSEDNVSAASPMIKSAK